MANYRRKRNEEETSYWLSYSDMMAAVLLVFVLIISFTMLQAKKKYEQKEAEFVEQQEQLHKILGVKTDLIELLNDEFENTELKVNVDPQTGAITFDSSILFDVDEYELKDSGKRFLRVFLKKYLNVLLGDQFHDYVAEIIIEGHTDTDGDYMHNLKLSQERALSVATFCLMNDETGLSKADKKTLRKILTANGKSYSNPVYKKNGSVDMKASRRVEFKFRLKDEEAINEFRKMFDK